MTTASPPQERTVDVSTISIRGKATPAFKRITIPDSLDIVDDVVDVPKTKGVFRILTPDDGDKRVVWDTMSMQEINDAKAMFNEITRTGLRAYRVNENGGKAEQIDEFDATAGEILFLPVRAVAAG